jgi:hypothetical protein
VPGIGKQPTKEQALRKALVDLLWRIGVLRSTLLERTDESLIELAGRCELGSNDFVTCGGPDEADIPF